MARKSILTSDLTGLEIQNGATIRLQYGNDVWAIDVDADEQIVKDLMSFGRKQKKRGRKPKAVA